MFIQRAKYFWPRLFHAPFGHLLRGSDRRKFGWEALVGEREFISEPYHGEVKDPLDSTTLLTHAFSGRELVSLRGAVVCPISGAVSLQGVWIAESTTWNPQKVFFRSWGKPHEFNQASSEDLVFIGQRKWNYYHFLIEDFPLLVQAQIAKGKVLVLVGGDAPSYVFQALDFLGLPCTRIWRRVKVPQLTLLTRGNDTGWPHKDDVKALRNTALRREEFAHSPIKIYLSRRNSSRAFLEEHKVEQFFIEKGFTVITSETLTFDEQVGVFQRAAVVVGAHGAGLANAVFMPTGALLVELFHMENANPCFELLAETAGLRYVRIMVQHSFDPRKSDELIKLIEHR